MVITDYSDDTFYHTNPDMVGKLRFKNKIPYKSVSDLRDKLINGGLSLGCVSCCIAIGFDTGGAIKRYLVSNNSCLLLDPNRFGFIVRGQKDPGYEFLTEKLYNDRRHANQTKRDRNFVDSLRRSKELSI